MGKEGPERAVRTQCDGKYRLQNDHWLCDIREGRGLGGRLGRLELGIVMETEQVDRDNGVSRSWGWVGHGVRGRKESRMCSRLFT